MCSEDATGSVYWGWLHISPPRQETLRPEFNGMQIPYELSVDCACSRATAPDMTNQHSARDGQSPPGNQKDGMGRHGRPWPREREIVNGSWECPVDIRKRAIPRSSGRDLPNRAFGAG